MIVLGDFNSDYSKGSDLVDDICDLGMNQIMKKGTITRPRLNCKQSKGSLIDHIYSNTPSNIIESFVCENSASDHFPIGVVRKNTGNRNGMENHMEIFYRNFKKFNQQQFVMDLSYAPWSCLEAFEDRRYGIWIQKII